MKVSLRFVTLATVLVTAVGASSVLVTACGGGGGNKDAGADAAKEGGAKDAGVKDSGGSDADDGSTGPTLDPQCTVPAVGNGACAPPIGAGVQCNPVTNSGCDGGGGETCDFGDDGQGGTSIQCFPPPNVQDVCATCDNSQGPFCKPSDHCVPTTTGASCARMCCGDSDCTPGHCDTTTLGFAPIGVCVK